MSMSLDIPLHRTATAFAALISTGLFCSSAARAEETASVVIDRDETPCSPEFESALLDELRLRTAAELVEVTAISEAEGSKWRLFVGGGELAGDTGKCRIRLEGGEDTVNFVLANDADRVAIASVATRLAWILDGKLAPVGESTEQDSPPEQDPAPSSEDRSEPDTAATVDVSDGIETATAEPRRKTVGLEAMGGAMWIPSAGAGLPLVQLGVNWKPWTRLELGLVGRFPLGAAQRTVLGTQFTYRPWSVDLTVAYAQPLADWSVHIGGGARRTIPQLIVTDVSQGIPDEIVEGTPARVTGEPDSPSQNTLSAWSGVATTSVSRSIVRMLAVRLDVTGAASFADRKIRDDQRVILDLGRFDLDALLGLEVKF